MIGSFYAPKFKIERAKKHLAELETAISDYLAKEPARFETSVIDERGTRRFEFVLHLTQPGPLFGAIIGDVIHNLRAALDLTACELVRREEGVNANVGGIHFPICKAAKNFNDI